LLLIKFLWKFLELGLTQQTKVYEWWSYIKCWLIKYKEELEDFSNCSSEYAEYVEGFSEPHLKRLLSKHQKDETKFNYYSLVWDDHTIG